MSVCSYIRTCPPNNTCLVTDFFPALCATLIDNVGWVSISRFDSMIAACMFSTPKVAKSLAKSFFPLPFGPSYKELVFGECLPTYSPSVLL